MTSSREPTATSPLREVFMGEVRSLNCHRLGQIDTLLAEVERLSCELRGDLGGHVRRSAAELRAAFASRRPVEPAVDRLRGGLRLLRGTNRLGSRREFQRRGPSLARLEHVFVERLLPQLRGLGFDV